MNDSFIASQNSHYNGARPDWDVNSGDISTAGQADLNKVVRQAFDEQQARVSQLQAIVRFDVLPLVQGHSQVLLLLFRKLIALILDHPPQNSKLFIYLKCDRKAFDSIDLSLPEGFAPHELCFYTNGTITPEWEKLNSDTLATCQQLTHENKGCLAWQTAPGAGCLFTVTLIGKIN